MQGKLVAFYIKGSEKWYSKDMIPVGMGKEKVCPSFSTIKPSLHQRFSQYPDPGSCVKDQQFAAHLHGHAGTVSSKRSPDFMRQALYKRFYRILID